MSALEPAYARPACAPRRITQRRSAAFSWRHVLVVGALLALTACAAPPPPAIAPPPPAPTRAWSAGAFADLRAAATAAPDEGLPAMDDVLARLDRLDADSVHDAAAAQRFDAAADALFTRLALGLAQGGADPARADPEWAIARAGAPDLAQLRAAIAAAERPAALLRALAPQSGDYSVLAAELARLRGEPGGADTQAQITSLRATLERWRWLPRDLPARRIEILTPHFILRFPGASPAEPEHAVIVGARAMATPSFTAVIESITLNPSWTPPDSIVRNELLPRFRRNPAAAAAEGFDAIDAAGVAADPAVIDWSERPFPYTLRQRPGPGNALGRVRFDLPNPFAIYLHDTPSRGLFARADRALSHGCIRVADPVALAAAASSDPAWSAGALDAAIAEGSTQTLTLPAPLPVYVLYMTARVGADGAVSYADDIYDRDAAVVAALDAPSPPQRASAPHGGCGV
ncbi:MAG: L,D-transpeptidase family protein [Hyphomonadaceae bacterium]